MKLLIVLYIFIADFGLCYRSGTNAKPDVLHVPPAKYLITL